MKILVATQKPFATEAVAKLKEAVSKSEHELVLFENYAEQSDFVGAVSDCDALIIRSDKVTKEVMDAAPNLKIVVRAGAGYDNVDCEAASAKNIVVMNTPGQNSNAVAELALGMMIMAARGCYNGKSGSELKGKTLGIHAYGNVGCLVGNIAKGFGMNVIAFDPFIDKCKIEEGCGACAESVEDLYSKSDYLSLHIPANDKTKKSINYELLSKMPKGACLVNTARKEVIDEDGLLKKMQEDGKFKYMTDIAPEKLDEFNAFTDRFFATPKKMGAQTAEANINAAVAAAEQIIAYFQDGTTTFQVNK